MDSLRAVAALSVFVYHVAFVLDAFDDGRGGRRAT
jgi:peptidoglycan/LPS O-acetylase OafA/YrhL